MITIFEKYENDKIGDTFIINLPSQIFSFRIHSYIPISTDVVKIIFFNKSTVAIESMLNKRMRYVDFYNEVIKKLNTKEEVDREIKKITDKIKKIEDDYILLKETEKDMEKYNL